MRVNSKDNSGTSYRRASRYRLLGVIGAFPLLIGGAFAQGYLAGTVDPLRPIVTSITLRRATLWLGVYRPPVIAPSYLCVCLRSRGRVTRLENIAELRGKVRITSASDCLAYVRVATCPLMGFRVGPLKGVEVVAKHALRASNALCDDGLLRDLRRYTGTGLDGITDETVAGRLGVRPRVVHRGGQFTVIRVILIDTGGQHSGRLARVCESVARDGSYRLNWIKFLTVPNNAGLRFQWPTYF